MAQNIPLLKKFNPSSLSDYRPISILPFFSKVLERFIYTQLRSFLSRNYNTITAILNVMENIRFSMEEGKLSILALLDFSNAFNTVDFDVLLGILCSLNISPSAIDSKSTKT